MDITNFITWFIDQVVEIFSKFFTILDSITFSGTSLLRVIVFIMIMIPLFGVLFTISSNDSVVGSRSDKVRSKKERKKDDEAKE